MSDVPPAYLAVREGPPYQLEGDSLTLGRGLQNDIVVEDTQTEHTVSRRHAGLERAPDGWWLTDLGTSAGVWVNGKQTERCLLRDGDIIQCGAGVPLIYRTSAESSGADAWQHAWALHRQICTELHQQGRMLT